MLDSSLDRISEAVLLLAIMAFHLLSGNLSITFILVVTLALIGSPMVSYVRARAETIGLECKTGLFTRAERVITLTVGLWLSQFSYALVIAIGIIAVFSFITTAQRLSYVRKQTRE